MLHTKKCIQKYADTLIIISLALRHAIGKFVHAVRIKHGMK